MLPGTEALKARSVARNWPELERKVIDLEAEGQVIWQPRVLAWRDDKLYFHEPLPEPYDRLTVPDMFRYLDCSARIYEYNRCFRRVEHRAVQIIRHDLGDNQTLIQTVTPVGEQTEIIEQRPTCRAGIHRKRSVVDLDDLRVATWRAENAHYEFDQAAYDELYAQWSDLGLPTMYLPRVNVQDLYINTMGTQAAIYAMFDWGDEKLGPYFRALDDLHDQLIDVINSRPEFLPINFGDNVHARTLPPAWFEKYVLPAYQRRCDRLHQAGKFVFAHWDGDVAPLLRYVHDTHLDGIEAITPVPQGDVTLEQVKEALGDKLFLVDGIPAVYFDPTYEIDDLIDATYKIIDLFSPRLILGISDEISSHGDIERVRLVGEVVDRYNEKLRS